MKNRGALILFFLSLCLILTACGGGGGGFGGGGDNNGGGSGGGGGSSNDNTVRVSVHSDGSEGNNISNSSSISSDGRYVAFESDADNLVAGDSNTRRDIFVHDRDSDGNGIFDEAGGVSTIRVSVDSNGNDSNDNSYSPSISSDGSFVAFESDAGDLVSGDSNVKRDIFVRDLNANSTTRVSVDANGFNADGLNADNNSYAPSISSDGRYVAFESDADDLVFGDSKLFRDIFVRDLNTNSTVRVSDDSSAFDSDNNSYSPSISSDGRYVAFESDAGDLVSGDSNVKRDIFIRNLNSNRTTRVSVDPSGNNANKNSYAPSVSTNGKYVAFGSDASNLVTGDTNGTRDIFVKKP